MKSFLGKEKLSQLLSISPEAAQKLTASFLGKYEQLLFLYFYNCYLFR